MNFLFEVGVFFLGTFIGSFLGVIIDRLPKGESIVSGRSHCDFCQKKLGPLDLFPIFSFLLLGGKCRYCHKKLSFFYPGIELITGVLFALSFIVVGLNLLQLGFYFLIVSILIAIFFIDLKHYIIPFPLIFPAIVVTFLYQVAIAPTILFNYLLAAGGASLFFLLLFLGTRGRGMGFGDVVYSFFMGLLLGFPTIIVGLYISFVSGALVGLLFIIQGKKKLKGTLPFGPFLVAGTLISLFWGNELIDLTFRVLQLTIK